MKTIKFLLVSTLVILLLGCSPADDGPAKVKWDRDVCDRCQMMLSEKKYAAQIRVFPPERPSQVFKFDDFGCAVLWLDNLSGSQMTWKDDPKTQFWVMDYQTEKWIDAKTAYYIKAQKTPMNYGLGAREQQQQNALDFAQAQQHVREVERKLNIHGGNLSH